MWFFAHVGLTIGAARLLEFTALRKTIRPPDHSAVDGSALSPSPVSIDYPAVAVASVLPDLDKLISLAVAGRFDRSVFHTLAAPGVLMLVSFVWLRRTRDSRLLQVAAVWFFHLVLDGMWAHRDLLLWPFCRSRLYYGRMSLPAFLAYWHHSLVTDPRQYLPEILGALLLAIFALAYLLRTHPRSRVSLDSRGPDS